LLVRPAIGARQQVGIGRRVRQADEARDLGNGCRRHGVQPHKGAWTRYFGCRLTGQSRSTPWRLVCHARRARVKGNACEVRPALAPRGRRRGDDQGGGRRSLLVESGANPFHIAVDRRCCACATSTRCRPIVAVRRLRNSGCEPNIPSDCLACVRLITLAFPIRRHPAPII
jgi:hypothetical protein